MIELNQYIKDNLLDVSPVPCKFKRGDSVTFTNEYGVKFYNLKVVGFDTPSSDYLRGRFIHLNTSSYWFPHHESELSITPDYESRVQEQLALGMSRGDAQGIVDAQVSHEG